MKSILTKSKLFAFLTVISLALLLNGCSKDDENTDSSSTFLETYDNTVWRFDYSGTLDGAHHFYFKFENNTYAPLKIWHGSSADNVGGSYTCTYYRLFNLDSKTMQVENTKDRFILRFETDPNFWVTYEFSINGDNLSLNQKANDNYLYKGEKSTKDLESLNKCSSPLF